MEPSILIIIYLVASVTFIIGLKMLSHPDSARRGNLVADNLASNLQVSSDLQVVYAEFEGKVSKALLNKITGVTKVESVGENSFLIESESTDDLRKTVAQFAQANNLLVLTLRTEEKSLEEVFKSLTK